MEGDRQEPGQERIGLLQVLFPAHTAYLSKNPIGGSPEAQIEYANNINSVRGGAAILVSTPYALYYGSSFGLGARACGQFIYKNKDKIPNACKNPIFAAVLGASICTHGAEGKPPGSARSYPQRREDIENVRRSATEVPRKNTGGIRDK